MTNIVRRIVLVGSGWSAGRWLNKPKDVLLNEQRQKIFQKFGYVFYLRTASAYLVLTVLQWAFNLGVHWKSNLDTFAWLLPMALISIGNLVMGLLLLALTRSGWRAQTARDMMRPAVSAVLLIGIIAVFSAPFTILHHSYVHNFRGYPRVLIYVLDWGSPLWLWCVLVGVFAILMAPLYTLRASDGHPLLPPFTLIFTVWLAPYAQMIFDSVTGARNLTSIMASKFPADATLLRFGFVWGGTLTVTVLCIIEILIARHNGVTIRGGSRGHIPSPSQAGEPGQSFRVS